MSSSTEGQRLQPGHILAGKYRIDRVLGEGGMGYVVAAWHQLLEEPVAIKFLHGEALQHEHIVQRFAREARAAAKIKSEHVARMLDVGAMENGVPYIVMEFLEGEDLSARLEREGRLPIDQAVTYIVEASEALAEAHVLGIVHRDLKPANLFLARRPSGARVVKLLDFGISKNPLKDETDHGLTSTQMMMGTPHYMSPEQIRSTRNVDSRTDIWALGVILYELIAGTLPFQGETATGIIAAIISEEARPLKQLVPEVPDALAAAVHRCLQRDREQRFKNVGELAAELARFGGEGSRQKLPHILNIVSGSQGTLRPATDLGTVSATTGSSIKENSTRINWNQTTGAGTRVSSPRGAYIALAVAGVVLTGAVAVVTATVLRGPGPSAALQPEPPLPERPSTLETPKNPGADGSAATMAAVVSVAPLPGPTAASADAAPLPASSPPPPRRVEPRRTEPEPRRPPPAPGPVAAATPDPTSTEQVAPPPTDRTPDTPPTGRGSLDMGLK